MNDLQPSIWQQNHNGEWKLYFNVEPEFAHMLSTSKINSDLKTDNFSGENLILGTLVMTPKGIGRLIKRSKETCHIKYNEELKEEEFEINKISNNFYCLLTQLSNNKINVIRIKLKVIGKVEDIYNDLEKIMNIKKEEMDYSLIYNGNILKKDFTFEQLNVINNCKILLLKQKNKMLCVSRFQTINKFWFTYTIDGICFNPSEKIKLAGIGVYGSYENKTVYGILKILDGPSINSTEIYEENVEIPYSKNISDAIIKIFFKKQIICQKNGDYSIVLYSKNLTNSYVGQQGKKIVEGDNGISFSFKKIQGRGSGTSVEVGNFPEIYYYLH